MKITAALLFFKVEKHQLIIIKRIIIVTNDGITNNLFDTKLSSHYCFAFKSELFTDLLARANALREVRLIRDGIVALSNANHSISINV